MGVPGSANLLLLGGEQGYKISRSLRFNSADSTQLERVPASNGNLNTWTISLWLKRGALATGSNQCFIGTSYTSTSELIVRFNTDDTLRIEQYSGGGVTNLGTLVTTQVFRDPSAWYHIVYTYDSGNATSSDRVRLYVNGTRVTAFSTATYPAQNADSAWNRSTHTHYFGRYSTAQHFNGYLTEINFIDGQALTPSSFGETDTITGVWKPKKYAGTYGTNGFYLNFSDNSGTTSTTLGKDSSGNGNNWTPNNFSVTAGAGNDSLIDTPTPYADGGNGRGNYCTLNPLTSGSFNTLANGNLQLTGNTSTNNGNTRGTFAFTTGKWYLEMTASATSAGVYPSLGIIKTANASAPDNGGTNQVGYPSDSVAYENSGSKRINNSTSSYGNSFTTGDTIGVAIDADNGAIYFSKNGTWQNSGVPTSGGSKTGAAYTWTGGSVEYIFATAQYNASSADYNFGQRPFAYTPPSGFVALNTQNLPEPSIKKPGSYFDVKLYTGTNATQSITGLGFSPDLAWIKSRSEADQNVLCDAVRGASNRLFSNLTNAEQAGGLVSLDSSGFTLGNASTSQSLNNSGTTYVAWCWDESATPGFDIVTYTGNGTAGRTISHNLGVAPSLIIAKGRTNADNWPVGHASRGWDRHLLLNSTAAEAVTNTTWNNTAPTSSVFTVGSDSRINQNTITYVAYLWSEVAGFSKFGSYTGNGSSDGPFVFLGFKPRFILFKNTTNFNWQILDTARADYNQGTVTLFPNLSNAENTTATQYDILSNGFKIRTSDAGSNGSGNSIIFAAFAENPFKYALAR
jgi:hypothetical protein